MHEAETSVRSKRYYAMLLLLPLLLIVTGNLPLNRTVCVIIIMCAFSRLYPVLNASDHSPCFGNMLQTHENYSSRY